MNPRAHIRSSCLTDLLMLMETSPEAPILKIHSVTQVFDISYIEAIRFSDYYIGTSDRGSQNSTSETRVLESSNKLRRRERMTFQKHCDRLIPTLLATSRSAS
jgi:hypothetical protein